MNVADGSRAAVLALADRMAAAGMGPMESILLDRTYPERYRQRHPGHFAAVRGRWYANDPVSFAHFFRMLAASDLRDELGDLRCPVWYGSGQYDVLRPPEYVRDLAERTPGARVCDLDAGHHVADHAPQEVAQMLTELVSEVSAAAVLSDLSTAAARRRTGMSTISPSSETALSPAAITRRAQSTSASVGRSAMRTAATCAW
ncbi:alpha/beta fold hydrolase [Rhodovulum sulfidophilum]|uniref:alpha/beta fold hydrolase n=1 Tax=Rhodovulum sulfidophilum TaxID=35806 RepID=UPI00192ED4A5|nr:alpha/beta hydrolase [Rhodovulum sulfidophilum]